MITLGFDTSNYTTSAAWFDGKTGENHSRLLDVKPGELGLRQSDALFAHVQHAPPGSRGVLYALLCRRDLPRRGAGHGAAGSGTCFFPPARAPGRRALVGGPAGFDGQALSGVAPVGRHHGITVGRAERQGVDRPASCWACPSRRARRWTR